jgi:hypothetical protein
MRKNISCPGIIALTSGNVPNYQVIPRLDVWEARQTLGVQPAPDGNYRKEGGFRLFKGNIYANRLSTSNLNDVRSEDSKQDTVKSSASNSQQA